MCHVLPRRIASILIAILTLAPAAVAQKNSPDIPDITSAWALTNVRVDIQPADH